jgi:PTS system fructose-specific IIC component
MFFVAVAIGTAVTAVMTVVLVDVSERKRRGEPVEHTVTREPELALVGAGVGAPGAGAVVGLAEREVRGATAASAESAGSVGNSAGSGPRVRQDAPAADTAPEVRSEVPSEVLSGYLTEQTVKVRLDAVDKEAAIREMAGLLARTGKVVDVGELVATALRREAQGTTGLGEEIAIPHAKTDAVSAPVVGFARSAEGVEWGSLDGTKARLVFMIAVPEAAAGDEHLRILALLSRKLMDAGFRERLSAAEDESAVLGVLSEVG